MKKNVSLLLILCVFLNLFTFTTSAEYNNSEVSIIEVSENGTVSTSASVLASGIILSYAMSIEKKSSTVLYIHGLTSCVTDVVKCGFKDFEVQRRKNSSYSWTVYHDYGNDYLDDNYYQTGRNLTVEPGYQYRVVCKHYAKKSLLSTQTISNETGGLTF